MSSPKRVPKTTKTEMDSFLPSRALWERAARAVSLARCKTTRSLQTLVKGRCARRSSAILAEVTNAVKKKDPKILA